MNPLLLNHLIGFTAISLVLPAIAFTVYRSRPDSVLNRSFAFYCLTIAWWAFFTILAITASTKSLGLYWDRVCLTGTVFIPSSLFHFIVSFTKDNKKLKGVVIGNYVVSGLFLSFLWSTRLFVADVAPKFGMNYFTIPGPLYALFIIFFVTCVILALTFLWKYSRNVNNERIKKQARILFWFSVVGYSGGSCNYLLAYDINIANVAETSNYGVLLLSISIAYIIFKYQFLDIEVIIKKTLVFTGLFGGMMAVVAGVTTFLQGVVGQYFQVSTQVTMALSVAVAIFLYEPVKKLLTHATDKFLFQKKESAVTTLNRLSHNIITILDIHEVGRTILQTLKDSIRLEAGAIMVRAEGMENFRVLNGFGLEGRENSAQFGTHAAFFDYFQDTDKIVNLDLTDKADLPPMIVSGMEALKAVVAIPLFYQNKLLGILTLGKKISDQEYTRDEMDYFPTLAGQVAVALSNAQLVEEVVEEREEKLKAQSEAKMVNYAKTIGHEIKNALVGIEGPAIFLQKHQVPDLKKIFERAAKEDLPSGMQRKFQTVCEKIEKQGKDIFDRVQKIRVIASTAQGTLRRSKEDFDDIYFKILWDSVKDDVGHKDIRYDPYIPDNFVVYGNLVLLQRVFINMINNAHDAMQGQAEKVIILKARYDGLDEGAYAYIELGDNGPGIPAEMQGKIFEQGFSTKPKPEVTDIEASGHGQGLYVCKEVIEEIHGGKLELKSAPGEGTTFIFRLPIKKGAKAGAA